MAAPAELVAITDAERKILAELGAGRTIEISLSPAALEAGFGDHDWPSSEVRGEFLAEVARSRAPRTGVSIFGAWISGTLDLRWSKLPPLVIGNSKFERRVRLDGAVVETLSLDGCSFPGLTARWARIGNLSAVVVRCQGKLSLSPLHVGHLDLRGAHVSVPRGPAINANVMTSERTVQISGRAVIRGGVSFIGAKVGGRLDLRESRFEGHGDVALALHEASVARSLYLRGATFRGTVNLSAASIGGRVDGRDARFSGPNGLAIDMNACTVERAVQLDGAQVGGELRIVAGRIGTYMRAGGGGRFIAPSAEVASRYGRAGDDLERLSGFAVLIERTSVGRDIAFFGGTAVSGLAVRRSQVGDSLRLDGAVLGASREGVMLDATATRVSGALVLQVKGVAAPKPKEETAPAAGPQPKGVRRLLADLKPKPMPEPESRTPLIDMSYATVERLEDRLPWPCEGLRLEGFTYRALVGDTGTQKEEDKEKARLQWVQTNRPISAQPYEQLASVYRSTGYPDAARSVLYQRDDDLRRSGRLSRWSRAFSWFFKWTVGYGYRLHRALVGLVVLWAAGAVVFAVAWRYEAVHLAGQETSKGPVRCPVGNPCFVAGLLSLDVVVPVVDVGQEGSWVPRGWFVQWWAVGQAAAGWALTTAAVAGYARKVQRP